MLTQVRYHEQKTLTNGARISIDVPVDNDQCIHDIPLLFVTSGGAAVTQAQLKAEITRIELLVNGTTIVAASPTELYRLQAVLGVKVANAAGIDGALNLNIGRAIFTNPALRDTFKIGMANLNTIQVIITVGTLSAVAAVQLYTTRERSKENFGVHLRAISYGVTYASTGVHTYSDLPRNSDSAYLAAVVLPGGSGVVKSGRIYGQGVDFYQTTLAAANKMKLAAYGLNQEDNTFVFDFNDNSTAGSSGKEGVFGLPMLGLGDFKIDTDFGTAPTNYSVLALTVNGLPQQVAK